MLLRYVRLCLLPVLLLASCNSTPEPTAPTYLTTTPDPKTLGEAYVSDPNQVLAPGTVADLNATLRALDQSGRAHIDVVLVSSIGDESPKTAAHELFNRWKIGDKDSDNGLLMLLVMDQRRIEFETGYGLEADLPDVLCFRIQQRYMVPALKAGSPDEAVRQGVAATIRQLTLGTMEDTTRTALSYGLAPEIQPEPPQYSAEEVPSRGPGDGVLLIVGFSSVASLLVYAYLWYCLHATSPGYGALSMLLMLLTLGLGFHAFLTARLLDILAVLGGLYVLLLLYVGGFLVLVRRRAQALPEGADSRHQRYLLLHEAHYGLGFLAYLLPLPLWFYWRHYRQHVRQLREAPYACPHCATAMRRLAEQTDDDHLALSQAAEEHVKSIDYDVWQCPQCQHTLTLAYPELGTDVRTCTKCRHQTLQPRADQVVERATTSSGGWGYHVFRCYFCNHEEKERYTIPRISTSSGSSSSSSSSSSTSSSGSSSSGGSSGGGGAGSSW